ncbi:C-C motif chemokine 5 [Lates calcarifer]|uniref:C-C motif chemokine 5 n=1 Tax=Lates calcarifer TaxID=8187 RepID=A0A4W6EQR6_LATCA|nr:C-C motif chemokine 5 [Lates calcarifer]
MDPRGMITLTIILLFFIHGNLSPAPAALGSKMSKSCCTKYNRSPVPVQRIVGYREQRSTEMCRMEAIIFLTVKKIEICATRQDEWVRKTLESLSTRLKKMSKTGPATPKKKGNESGSIITTTESFLNNTESFY